MTPSHTSSQRYFSTRGCTRQLSFENVVFQGLAEDGGLFIPVAIPTLPEDWFSTWRNLSFTDLAFEIFSLYISTAEIPSADLKDIIQRSYATFRVPEIAPLVTLNSKLGIHLLELFHGPTFAFKDVALQFLGNLFEYFLARRNKGKVSRQRDHLTVIGATSGDTGSAAIQGLRGKADVSIFILYPKGKVSPVQEAQMTTVTDANVHNIAVDGTFDECQEYVKALFADPIINETYQLAAVNSINWARILAQITYYFSSYFSLIQSPCFAQGDSLNFSVPTGNFGDILAGYLGKRMGLPFNKLIVATNENDILHRFWSSGNYEKKDGNKAKETYSPAMDILVSSNFERFLWFLASDVYGNDLPEKSRHEIACRSVADWFDDFQNKGEFAVHEAIRKAAAEDFESERVSDPQTLETIFNVYTDPSMFQASKSAVDKIGTRDGSQGYVLDPHTAIGVTAAIRIANRVQSTTTHHISLATAHPAKFPHAIQTALGNAGFLFENILPDEFMGLQEKTKRLILAKKEEGREGIRKILMTKVRMEENATE